MTSCARPAGLLACLAAVAVAGCGGADRAPRDATPPQASIPGGSPLEPPRTVPRDGAGRAPAEAQQVVTRWLQALTRGDVEAAARLWALPSRFQNGTPVLRIDSAAERLAVNASLPCGGAPTEVVATRAPSYVVVTIELRARPGGGPPQACDGLVRSAVQVRDGRIAGLFRLPDGGGVPSAPAGEQTQV